MNDASIGFFDSGVGGISVLKEAVKILPFENYIYYGDSKNAPYGTKDASQVLNLTMQAADFLLKRKVKAIVIACNTATSAAINDLRRNITSIPVIGIEPALKPAVMLKNEGKILIMATNTTLHEPKFNNLMKRYEKCAEIEKVPCPGLVEFIEHGILSGEGINSFLRQTLKEYSNSKIAAVVLGCTHYPFVKDEIKKIVGKDVPVIDGGMGTAKQLKSQLRKYKLLNDSKIRGKIEIYNSLNTKEMIELSRKLFKSKE